MTTRTETREREGDYGQREFCQLEVTLREREDGPELSICGTAGIIVKHREAKLQAREHWESYFEDEPGAIAEMNGRCGTKFRSPKSAARYVLEQDGEFHGLDVIREDDGDIYLGHSFGQIRDEISESFPEATQFYRFHMNGMSAACEHQQARGEKCDTHPGYECLECGWKLGAGWYKRELPAEVVHWAKTGDGHAPSEPHYVASPQFIVRGSRKQLGAIGLPDGFILNGAAPDAEAAIERARSVLLDRYDHVHLTSVSLVNPDV